MKSLLASAVMMCSYNNIIIQKRNEHDNDMFNRAWSRVYISALFYCAGRVLADNVISIKNYSINS